MYMPHAVNVTVHLHFRDIAVGWTAPIHGMRMSIIIVAMAGGTIRVVCLNHAVLTRTQTVARAHAEM